MLIMTHLNYFSYKENAKKLASLAKDQPMTGLEKVIWWTEYVIRNNGAKHLKNPAVELPLYQYFHLDVAVVIATFLLFTLAVFWIVLKISLTMLSTVAKYLFKISEESDKKKNL